MTSSRVRKTLTIGMLVTFGFSFLAAFIGYITFDSSITTADTIATVNKLVIDTDAGADDAVAILLALSANYVSYGPTIVGITCVNGNTGVDNVSSNVLKILQVIDRLDIPVYKGASRPLVLRDEKTNYFGSDGFGDFEYPDPPSMDLVNETHATIAMIDLVKANPGDVTLLALGPLTNIALAIRIYPSFLDDLRELIVMGGSVEGFGNMKNNIEYNFMVDPEANYIVFNASESKAVTLVPYETTLRANTTMEFRTSWNETNNRKVWILNAAASLELNRTKTEEYWYCADAVAAAVALTSGDIVTRSSYYYGEAIYDGVHTRGMIMVDYGNVTSYTPNIYLIQDIDSTKYEEMFIKYLNVTQQI